MSSIYKIQKIKFWQVLLSLALFILALLFLLPIMDTATGSIVTPDADFFYNHLRLTEIKDIYTQENISAYIHTRIAYDILWPLIYGFFLISTLGFMTKSTNKSKLLTALYFMPILAVLFDLLENTMCSFYFSNIAPSITLYIAPIASALKWILIFIIFTIQFVLLVIRLFQQIKMKKN
jgi:hypothetical protein